MSSVKGSREDAVAASAPSLPANVCIFSPGNSNTVEALMSGRIFTRLAVNTQTPPSKLSAALGSVLRPVVGEACCLSHRNSILIFDAQGDADELQNLHHENFRLVCLALKDADISLDVAGCIFDAPSALEAGFQLDKMSQGSVLVIDLMDGDDDDDDDDEDSDSDHETALQGVELGRDSDAAMSRLVHNMSEPCVIDACLT